MDDKKGKTKSNFVKIECKNCGNTQVAFDRASTEVKCLVCNTPLVKPTGGVAKIHAEVKRTF